MRRSAQGSRKKVSGRPSERFTARRLTPAAFRAMKWSTAARMALLGAPLVPKTSAGMSLALGATPATMPDTAVP